MSRIRKTLSYLKRNGLQKTWYQVRQRLREEWNEDNSYEKERLTEAATTELLKAQAGETFPRNLKISILVPAYETPEEYLRMLVDSVLVQSYENLELCVADAGTTDVVSQVMSEYDDPRIRYQRLDANEGIAGNTNRALAMATGDVVTLLDHDDFIEPDALYRIARAFEEGARAAYTDEDKYESGRYFKPNRKTSFNPDLLLSNNYICHLFAVSAEIARGVGGLRSDFDGAQDYDFILRCIEEILRRDGQPLGWTLDDPRIVHIPKVLYHWRVHENSTAENPESKRYAYEAGKRVLEAFLERNGLKGTVHHTEHLGFYRIEYPKGVIGEDVYTSYIAPGLTPAAEDNLNRLASLFERPDVAAVMPRILDGKGRTLGCALDEDGEPLYKGMKQWDSGLMHRAHQMQDSSQLGQDAWLIRRGREEMIAEGKGLILYDPGISYFKK